MNFKRAYPLNVVRAPYQDDGGDCWGSRATDPVQVEATQERIDEAVQGLADLPEFNDFMKATQQASGDQRLPSLGQQVKK